VYRFNTDYSWQFDWADVIPANPSISCAWKLNEAGDTLTFIRYNLMDVGTRNDEVWEVIKLEGDDLWLKMETDFFGPLLVEQRYVRKPRSSDFTPNRGVENPDDYVSPNCIPGSY
jgi:hypothetical protein